MIFIRERIDVDEENHSDNQHAYRREVDGCNMQSSMFITMLIVKAVESEEINFLPATTVTF